MHRKLYSCIMAYRWFFRDHNLELTHVYIDNLGLCTKAVDSEQHRSWSVTSRCLQRAQMSHCKRLDILYPKNIISFRYDYNQPLYSIRIYLWKGYLLTVSHFCLRCKITDFVHHNIWPFMTWSCESVPTYLKVSVCVL